MPEERELTDAEREEIQAAAIAALDVLGPHETVVGIVEALEARVLARRMVKSDHDDDVLQLGSLFAHCLEEALGWDLVELEWESLTAMAVVPFDRSLAILPHLAVGRLFDDVSLPGDLASTFARLEAGERPPGISRGDRAVLLP